MRLWLKLRLHPQASRLDRLNLDAIDAVLDRAKRIPAVDMLPAVAIAQEHCSQWQGFLTDHGRRLASFFVQVARQTEANFAVG